MTPESVGPVRASNGPGEDPGPTATYYRTRQGAMIHRDGCHNLRRRNVTAVPWRWADGLTFDGLVAAMSAEVGYDPDMRVCADCFGRGEQLEWWRRVQGGEREEVS